MYWFERFIWNEMYNIVIVFVIVNRYRHRYHYQYNYYPSLCSHQRNIIQEKMRVWNFIFFEEISEN